MHRLLAILSLVISMLSACGIHQDKATKQTSQPKKALSKNTVIKTAAVNTINANILANGCPVKDDKFNTLSFLQISNLLQIDSAINADLNHDKRNDNIVLVRPSPALSQACHNTANYNKDSFKLIADVSRQAEPLITDLGIEYISGARVKALANGFVFSNEIGQSIKCLQEAIFEISGNNIYLSKVRTICWVPNANIGWQERDFDKSTSTLLQNVNLTTAFDGLRDVFFEYRLSTD